MEQSFTGITISTGSGSDGGRGGDIGSHNSISVNSGSTEMKQDFKVSTISTGSGSGGGRGGDVGSGNWSVNSRMNQGFNASAISTGSGSGGGRGGDLGSHNSSANSKMNQVFKASTISTGSGYGGGRGGDVGSGNSSAKSRMNQDFKASTISTGSGSGGGRGGDVGSGNSTTNSGMNQSFKASSISTGSGSGGGRGGDVGSGNSGVKVHNNHTPTSLRLSNDSPWNTGLSTLDGQKLYRIDTPLCPGSRTTIVSRVTRNVATEVASITWHRSGVETFRFQGKEIDYYSYFRTDGFLSQHRTFTAPDGILYRWNLGTLGRSAPTLELLDAIKTRVAKFYQKESEGGHSSAYLRIFEGGELIMDQLVVTFVLVEKLRRDRWSLNYD